MCIRDRYEEPELPGADCPLTPLLRGLLAKDPALRPGADEGVAFLTVITAIPSGGETRLPEVTPPPTVAGTSRPPSSPATTPAPR